MTKSRNIKEAILKEAFKLFLSKPYDKVTYTDLEKTTGFSRGAILHHFRLKQDLLEQVVDKYLFRDNSIFDFYNEHIGMTFLSFIHIYCDWIENKKKMFRGLNVDNYSLALVNITLQAFYFYPHMMERVTMFRDEEKNAWCNILKKGIEAGELRQDIDVLFIARSIQVAYYGTSYTGLIRSGGVEVSFLKEQLLYLYDTIKAG